MGSFTGIADDMNWRHRLLSWPYREAVNPHFEAARSHTFEWLRKFGLIRSDDAAAIYRTWNLDALGASIYLHAGLDELRLITDWIAWITLADDVFDTHVDCSPEEVGALIDSVFQVCEAPDLQVFTQAPPGIRSFADLWRRFGEGMPESWRARLAETLRRDAAGVLAEARFHALGTMPTLEEFLAVRCRSIWSSTCYVLTERVAHCSLPESMLDDAIIARLRSLSSRHAVLVNEVFSIRRDASGKARTYNATEIVMRNEGCDVERATAMLCQMANESAGEFSELRCMLPLICREYGLDQREKVSADIYVQGLENLFVGHKYWLLHTVRSVQDALQAVCPPEVFFGEVYGRPASTRARE